MGSWAEKTEHKPRSQLSKMNLSELRCEVSKQMLSHGSFLPCDYNSENKQLSVMPSPKFSPLLFLPNLNKWKPNESLAINKMSN